MGMTVNLLPYQEPGVDQLLENGYGILAFEQGLGKTVSAIAIVEELLVKPDINFALIVAPSALKYQWAKSIAKFTDVKTKQMKLRKQSITIPTEEYCVVVDGPPAKRQEQYDFIYENWPNYVIVSYEQVRDDFHDVFGLGAECVILDEATFIKGFTAKRSRRVKQLDPQFAFALTGTPIENKAEELYSIMEFVCPGFLGDFEEFEHKYIVRDGYGAVKRYRNLDLLYKRLKKVLVRKNRLDPDVAPYMPDVDFKSVYVEMTPKFKKVYRKIAAETLQDLQAMQHSGSFDLAAYYRGEAGADMTEQGKIMAKVLALRMLCDHPELIRASAEKYFTTEEFGSKYAAQLVESGLLDDLDGSAKFDQIIDDVSDILDSHPENKVIIFSFFKQMGRLLAEGLSDYDSVLYNGDMNPQQKAEAQAKFQDDPNCRLFIASDAGGYGVDLPEANYLINVDLADSAGKMDQRNARHIRAGSKHKKVFVINYIVENSVEFRQEQRLAFKRKVAKAVIDGGKTDDGGIIEYDVATLTEFLAA